MGNRLRVAFIVVACIAGAANAAFVLAVVFSSLIPVRAWTEASVTYTLGGTTFRQDQTTVVSTLHNLLHEAGIAASVRAAHRGAADEGWWVDLKLLGIKSENELHLVRTQLEWQIMSGFPDAQCVGAQWASSGWFLTSVALVLSALGAANVLVAVVAVYLLLGYKPRGLIG